MNTTTSWRFEAEHWAMLRNIESEPETRQSKIDKLAWYQQMLPKYVCNLAVVANEAALDHALKEAQVVEIDIDIENIPQLNFWIQKEVIK